ncbi:MAG: hypothetical protein ACKO7W_08445 [Elainella sp.]
MPQTLSLFSRTPALAAKAASLKNDALLEQTRQLFQHNGSNTELMHQVMNAINVLSQLGEHPDESLE